VNILAWPAFDNKTGNPYTALLYENVEQYGVTVDEFGIRTALRGGYDLWHVHWPDDFLSYTSPVTAALYVLAELLLMAGARARGARLVWTIHDLGPHEDRHPWLTSTFWALFLPMVDGYITLSGHARKAALRRFPRLRDVPGAVVPHGHYRPAYPAAVPKETARRRMGLASEGSVAVYVGRIRPYKNVPRLVRAVRALDDEAIRLVVAGNPSSRDLERRIREEARGDVRIHLDLRFIPDERIPLVLGAADLVVLPYRDILHSGSALLALSFDRPVLVPDAGAMAELQAEMGDEWVYTYEGTLTPDTLTAALRDGQTEERARRPPLEGRSWDTLARETVALYERVRSG